MILPNSLSECAVVEFAINANHLNGEAQNVPIKARHFEVLHNETQEQFIKRLHEYMRKKGLHRMGFKIKRWPGV